MTRDSACVSIIIPCYNVDQYIEECIESAYNQTFRSIEVIAVDNNSTDKTLDRLHSLQSRYPDLTITSEHTMGAPAARNRGLEMASGDWIQFLDADDLLAPEKIEHQIGLLSDRDCECFIAGAYTKLSTNNHKWDCIPSTKNPWISLLNTTLGITSANLFNKKALQRVGGWDETYRSSQDAKLMFDLLRQHDQVLVDDSLLTILRERESGQISQKNPLEKWSRYVDLRLDIISFMEQYKPKVHEVFQPEIRSTLFNHIRVLARYDLGGANSVLKRHLPTDYRPMTKNGHRTPYTVAYALFGFRTTERLVRMSQRMKRLVSLVRRRFDRSPWSVQFHRQPRP